MYVVTPSLEYMTSGQQAIYGNIPLFHVNDPTIDDTMLYTVKHLVIAGVPAQQPANGERACVGAGLSPYGSFNVRNILTMINDK